MATPEDMAQALDSAGLHPVLVDTPPEPFHIAVPFPGQSIEDEPVLRINLLESADGDLDLWQLVAVIPAQAVSDAAWQITRNMLNTINLSLTAGKMLAIEDDQMVYFTYAHMTPPGPAALDSGPPVVAFVLENLVVLCPALLAALTTDPEPDFEAAERALENTHAALADLMQTLKTQR